MLRHTGWGAALVLPVLGYLCGLSEVADLGRPQFWIFYLAFAAAIPPLFALTKSCRLDARLGELSYPIYICHVTVIAVLNYFWYSAIPYDYYSSARDDRRNCRCRSGSLCSGPATGR